MKFEKDTDIKNLFEGLNGYQIRDNEIYYNESKVAELYGKNAIYKKLLPKYNVDWKSIVSSKLLPDEAILVLKNNTLYIIEKKIQTGQGSVDEKLQTCDFKKKKYERLFNGTGIKIEFAYVLNDWFKSSKYKDTLDFIHSVGCHYFFGTLPFGFLGLPAPKS